MKKIISLVLAALFVFSLSVSAMAAPVLEFPDRDKDIYPYVAVFYDDGDDATYIVYSTGPFEFDGNYYRKTDGTTGIHFVNGVQNAVLLSFSKQYYEPVYANYDIMSTSGSVAFPGTPEEEETCNGSACSANDANFDGICDHCGMRLMNLVRTPTAPEVNGSNKNFVMFYTGETYYYTVYTSNTAYSIRGYIYGTRMRSTSDIAVNVHRFESYDGLNWSSEYSGTAKDYYPGEQGWTLLSSSFNWYDSSENTSDPFFPVPLWAEVEKVTQGEIPEMTEQTMTTLGFLMLCGIGCLALLMVLALFGKRSLIYRG